MSYISINEANALVGETFTQEQLDAAHGILNKASKYRWEDTSLVERWSSEGISSRYLNMPITALTYLKSIDEEKDEETTLTRFDDYNYDKRTGLLVFTRAYVSSIFWKVDFNDFEVSYTYGWASGNQMYDDYIDIVKSIEARIALLYKKNPLRLKSINLAGDTINFEEAKNKILADLPKRPRVATYDTEQAGTDYGFRGISRTDVRGLL